ncbi:hypothetical protein [Flavobacterium sp.]
MKNIVFLILLSFSLITISCSTDEIAEPEVVKPEEIQVNEPFVDENPLQNFLNLTGYNQHQLLSCDLNAFEEVGLSFKPLEKGVLHTIMVKLPIINTNLLVTIKDVAANQILRIETINVDTANMETIKAIVPIELDKNKIYTITMKTNLHYKRFRTDYSQPQLPVIIGNLQIISPISTEFSPDGITTGGTGNFYSGDCDFTFLRTE